MPPSMQDLSCVNVFLSFICFAQTFLFLFLFVFLEFTEVRKVSENRNRKKTFYLSRYDNKKMERESQMWNSFHRQLIRDSTEGNKNFALCRINFAFLSGRVEKSQLLEPEISFSKHFKHKLCGE